MIIKSCETTLWQHLTRQGKGFTTVRDNISISGSSEVDWILCRNPSGSGVTISLNEIVLNFIPNAVAQASTFRFYRAPTITSNGSAMTINKVLPSHSNTSKVNFYTDPTISNRGSLITLFAATIGNVQREQDLSRYVEAGRDLLITVQPSFTGLTHSFVLNWAET